MLSNNDKIQVLLPGAMIRPKLTLRHASPPFFLVGATVSEAIS